MVEAPHPVPSGASVTPPGHGARQPYWALPFVLFVAGFVILIVASKIDVAVLPGYLLKGFGAALCVAGFLLVRRASLRKPSPPT